MKSLCYFIRSWYVILLLAYISSDILAQDNNGMPIPHFLFPSFTEGIVIMKDGKSFNALLNYNMADEMMVSEVDGVYRSANNPYKFDTIYIQNRTFVPIEKLFYELLSKGPANFLLQNKCSLTPKGNNTGYGNMSQGTGPTKMQRFELTSVVYQYHDVVYIDLPPNVDVTPLSVYWIEKSNQLTKFSTEKQFLKIFPDKATRLKEFIKKENISFNKREDIIKLGKYCNEIIKESSPSNS